MNKQSYYSDIINIKLYLKQETLQLGSNFSSLVIPISFTNKDRVSRREIMLLTRRQFAWINTAIKFIHQRLNVEHLISPFSTSSLKVNMKELELSEEKDMFYKWLVGFTEGDGSFSIIYRNNKWSLTYKLGQSTYNLSLLLFVKKQLGVGSIYVEKTGDSAHFRIRDRITLESVIFPIFDKYLLLTTKQFNYIKFKQAHAILSDNSLSKSDKDNLIFKIIHTKLL
uniref:LAGLIDADG endonuclease type 1 n=1 Tax=Amanita thiersii TaxID=235537 RepID=A0A5Q0N2B1_9AGAR|nr:LAGLIDADG endonuclease type 1 [Amanita thiersii]QFZ98694.1 LAGLIDADG endonuclease type 1 [Amanita thiersii]